MWPGLELGQRDVCQVCGGGGVQVESISALHI